MRILNLCFYLHEFLLVYPNSTRVSPCVAFYIVRHEERAAAANASACTAAALLLASEAAAAQESPS